MVSEEDPMNGTKYEGEKAYNIKHGKGKMTFKSGAYYEGSYVHGKMSGFGTLFS